LNCGARRSIDGVAFENEIRFAFDDPTPSATRWDPLGPTASPPDPRPPPASAKSTCERRVPHGDARRDGRIYALGDGGSSQKLSASRGEENVNSAFL
jgi:hypothetical protein